MKLRVHLKLFNSFKNKIKREKNNKPPIKTVWKEKRKMRKLKKYYLEILPFPGNSPEIK